MVFHTEGANEKGKVKAPHVKHDVWATQIRFRIYRPGHPPMTITAETTAKVGHGLRWAGRYVRAKVGVPKFILGFVVRATRPSAIRRASFCSLRTLVVKPINTIDERNEN